MATQQIVPTGTGTYNNWKLGAGANKYSVLTPGADSFSNGYIYQDTYSSQLQSFTHTAFAAHSASTSLVTYCYGGKNANQGFATSGWYDTAYGWRSVQSRAYNIFIWSEIGFSVTWSSPSDSNLSASTLEMMLVDDGTDATNPIYINSFYATYTYDPPAGEMFASIYSLVGPILVGATLLQPQFQDMLKYARVTYDEQELAQAWREYKDKTYKFPKYFQGGYDGNLVLV